MVNILGKNSLAHMTRPSNGGLKRRANKEKNSSNEGQVCSVRVDEDVDTSIVLDKTSMVTLYICIGF